MQHELQIIDLDEGVYEVMVKYERVTKHERNDHSYKIVVNPDQSLNISVANHKIHTLHALTFMRCVQLKFTNRYYTISTLQHMWEGRFEFFVEQTIGHHMTMTKIIPERSKLLN
jgi:hypothetical protein